MTPILSVNLHDVVIKWKHFPRHWPLVRRVQWSPADSPHKGQWRGALIAFFDLRMNKRLSKQPRRLWFGTPSRSLWRHSNGLRRHQSISRQILDTNMTPTKNVHEDVIKWKHFPRYWPFVWGIPRSPVNSPPKGQWRGALMFSLICARINGWVNNREAGDLRRHCAHYDIIVMRYLVFSSSCMLFEEAFCQRKCVTRGLIRTLPLYLWPAPKWWPLSRPFEYFIMDLQYWGPNKNGRHFRTTFQ